MIYFQVLGTCFCVQVSSYTVVPVFQCPDQYDRHAWFNRAIQVCPSDYQKYHCLMVVDEKTAPHYAEFCMTAQTIRKGSFRVLIKSFDLINLSYRFSLGMASSVDLLLFCCMRERGDGSCYHLYTVFFIGPIWG